MCGTNFDGSGRRTVACAATFALALLASGLMACGKAPHDGAPAKAQSSRHSSDSKLGRAVLTKEEVGTILGGTVTSAEGYPGDMEYKTAVLGLEAVIGLESNDDGVGATSGARKATAMLGGTVEDVPNLGDEAFFGAMSILYVRKGDIVVTITPPNMQLIAANAAYGKVTDAKMGYAEQLKALQEFTRVEKTDPLAAGLKSGDAMQGALATVAAASKKQGTAYETEARSMALALAAKLLTKL